MLNGDGFRVVCILCILLDVMYYIWYWFWIISFIRNNVLDDIYFGVINNI